jgi:translation initiation factor 5B
MSETEQRLRQPIVVVLGHVDSGKCISGETPVQLPDGTSLPARALFEKHSTGKPERRLDGEVYRADGLHLLSLGASGELAPHRVTHLWRMKADRLVKVRTDDGRTVSTTPEHMFLVLADDGRPDFVAASALNEGDILLAPGGAVSVHPPNEEHLSIHSGVASPLLEAAARLGLSTASQYLPGPGSLSSLSPVPVCSVELSEGAFDVYDFTVDRVHNFVAGGLLVHNTTLLDTMRGTGVQAREVGGITQEIGASFFPMETLRKICGPLLDRAGAELKIPGLLVIDTPGHEVFSNLRMRGGSAADMAIVVVDVLKGLENQTLESIDILKQRKVPFLVALNKIDMIKGWRKGIQGQLLSVMKQQPPEWNDEFEERLYNFVGGLSRLGFQSDAYYRVKDFRQQVAIVPVSARYGTGIPELLAVLIGLAQQFLKGRLVTIAESHRGRGIILEIQEETGIGQTANVILTEGKLRVGDKIVVMTKNGAVRSRVKALFMPKPLDEMRDPRDKFTPVDSVYAAAGVKLVTSDPADMLAGTTVSTYESEEEFESLKEELERELKNIVVKTNNMGVIVKAGSVGSLEALLRMLEEKGVPVRQADIGDISKNDIVEASVVGEHDPYLAAILAFNVKVLPEAREAGREVQIFSSGVIYEVVDSYLEWAAKKKEEDERAALSAITTPCKLRVIPGAFFRRNDPAVFGVEILAGRLRPKLRLMDSEGKEVGTVEQIQDKGKSIPLAKSGDRVAVSVRGPTLGRQVKENDVLYTFPKSHEVKLLKSKFLSSLSEDEVRTLDEIVSIASSKDPMYGF